MKCEDAVEFVSALCDGERIPREAAQHIGECEQCRALLHDYVFAGAELRRTASLHPAENVPGIESLLAKAPDRLAQAQKDSVPWWKKGAEAVKIPRFAFILMVLLIVGLSSGLVVVRARSNAQDAQAPVEILTLKVPRSDNNVQCAIATDVNSKKASCDGLVETRDSGGLKFAIRFLRKQGDQITLAIGAQFFPAGTPGGLMFSADDAKNLPTQQYEFQPGQTVDIPIDGLGTAELTGKPLDYLPPLLLPTTEGLSPARDEIRMISPLLLRGREAIIDMKGAAMGTGKDAAILIYRPGVGRLIVSTEKFQGATEGQVDRSRISFELNGAKYQLLAGAPITRAQHVWVALDPAFEPSDPRESRGVIGSSTLHYLLGQQQ